MQTLIDITSSITLHYHTHKQLTTGE